MFKYLYDRFFKKEEPKKPHEIIHDLLDWELGDELRLRDSFYVTEVPVVPTYAGADDFGIYVKDVYGEMNHVPADLASKAYYNKRLAIKQHKSNLEKSDYNKLLLQFQNSLKELKGK